MWFTVTTLTAVDTPILSDNAEWTWFRWGFVTKIMLMTVIAIAVTLYMVAPASGGGLALSKEWAGTVYAFYTFSVYALSVPGGWAADRFLGYRRAVQVGGMLIVLGEFGLASGEALPAGPFCAQGGRRSREAGGGGIYTSQHPLPWRPAT